MKNFLWLCLLNSCALAQSGIVGKSVVEGTTGSPVPVISSVTASPSANVVVVSWTTQTPTNSTLYCGTSPGSYTLPAVDNGTQTAVTSHMGECANLSPSSTVYYQISSTNSGGSAIATGSANTSALPASTPITSVTVATPVAYNSINANNQCGADTPYNAKSSDGVLYFLMQDVTQYCTEDGSPSWSGSSAVSLAKYTSESPLAAVSINQLSGYGISATQTAPDNRVTKSSGLFAIDGYLVMSIARSTESNFASKPAGVDTQPQGNGQLMHDHADHGATWDNFQNPNGYSPQGIETDPADATMFPLQSPSSVTPTFLNYAADDGTLGYLTPGNRHNDGEAYVYLISNEGSWDGGGSTGGGNAYYLIRVPRAKILNLNPADYQWYTGGGTDGNLNSSWGIETAATPIVSAYGLCGNPSAQYLPALNRYILWGFDYPAGDGGVYPSPNTANTVWTEWESPTPWGPWTQVSQQTWNGPGWYNPIMQVDTWYSGTSGTVFTTGNFGISSDYQSYTAQVTLN